MDISAISSEEEKRSVSINVTYLKIGEINTLKECFDADILVVSKWREPELDHNMGSSKTIKGVLKMDLSNFWNPEIYIDNCVGEPKVTITSSVDLEGKKAHMVERKRFKGTFLENMELWSFPFDVQDLHLNVTSERPYSEVLLHDSVNNHKMYKTSFIDENEWYLYKYVGSTSLKLPEDEKDATVVKSCVQVKCRAARKAAYFLWNTYTIAFLLTCLSFVTFTVNYELPHRITTSFTLILTLITFKFTVNQQMPKINYLSCLDVYILMSMLTVSAVTVFHGVQFVANHNHYDIYAWVIMGTIYLCSNLIYMIVMYKLPYGDRRNMVIKEKEYKELIAWDAKAKSPAIKTHRLRLVDTSAKSRSMVFSNANMALNSLAHPELLSKLGRIHNTIVEEEAHSKDNLSSKLGRLQHNSIGGKELRSNSVELTSKLGRVNHIAKVGKDENSKTEKPTLENEASREVEV